MFANYSRFTPPSDAVEKKVTELLAKLTLDEKIELLGGTGQGTKSIERLKIPALKFADGPLGVHWWSKAAAAYPSSLALAASFDPDLWYRFGESIGRDCRARGVHILLGPGCNIYRSARCGRNFEYLGEDPLLSARCVTEVIKGIQSQGVCATVKHYALNFQEYDRHRTSSDVDEKTLREVYLPAFEAAVKEGGAGAVMTAYNLINGVHASEHSHLLKDILRGEWGFKGLVMSDWVSVYSTKEALEAGLDLEMPTGAWLNKEKIMPLLENGSLHLSVIDERIGSLLRLMFCFGWFDHEQKDESISMQDPKSDLIAAEIALRGTVLLKNEGALLPLDKNKIKKIAVMGHAAAEVSVCGSGSAWTDPFFTEPLLAAVEKRFGKENVLYFRGPSPARDQDVCARSVFTHEGGKEGVKVSYFKTSDMTEDAPICTIEKNISREFFKEPAHESIPKKGFAARWEGEITPAEDGEHIFYLRSTDGAARVWVNGEKLFDSWDTEDMTPRSAVKTLKKGVSLQVKAEYKKTRWWASMRFGWEPVAAYARELDQAFETAKSADAVILACGFDHRVEGEGYDRTFELGPHVQELIRRVSSANEKTILVFQSGGGGDLASVIDKVPAVIHGFYGGQSAGEVWARLIFGEARFEGRMPFTMENKAEDRGSFNCYLDGGTKKVFLSDGLFTGWRYFDKTKVKPLFAFGCGVPDAEFKIKNAVSEKKSGSICVKFTAENISSAAGTLQIQLYLGFNASAERPPRLLGGFLKKEIAACASEELVIEVADSIWREWQSEKNVWSKGALPVSAELAFSADKTAVKIKI